MQTKLWIQMYRDDSREAAVQSISQSQWVLESTHKSL